MRGAVVQLSLQAAQLHSLSVCVWRHWHGVMLSDGSTVNTSLDVNVLLFTGIVLYNNTQYCLCLSLPFIVPRQVSRCFLPVFCHLRFYLANSWHSAGAQYYTEQFGDLDQSLLLLKVCRVMTQTWVLLLRALPLEKSAFGESFFKIEPGYFLKKNENEWTFMHE